LFVALAVKVSSVGETTFTDLVYTWNPDMNTVGFPLNPLPVRVTFVVVPAGMVEGSTTVMGEPGEVI
jgi:hypothetical protein